MKHTLKALKERVRPGTRLKVLQHWIARYIGTSRTVTRVQGNGYYFTTEGLDGEHWMEWPPASRIIFVDDDTFAVDLKEPGQLTPEKFWTLQFIEEGSA